MSNDLKWNENSRPNKDISRFVSKIRYGYREEQRDVYGPKTYELLYGEGGLFERLAGKRMKEMINEQKK